MKSSVNIGYVVFLSVVAALGGFLFGYDTAVISGTIAKITAQFNLDTMSQGWYVGCALIGSIVGVLFAGILSDKLGRKRTMILSAILFPCLLSVVRYVQISISWWFTVLSEV